MQKSRPTPHDAPSGQANGLIRTGLLLITLFATAASQAQPAPASAAAKAAWEMLSQNDASVKPTSPSAPQDRPQSASTALANPSATTSMVIQRGQTLDIIIRTHLPNVPYKIDLVRRAIMDLNPGAFPMNSPHLIRAGTALMIPSPDQLRQLTLSRNPTLASYLGDPLTDSSAKRTRHEDQSQWVRFP